MKAISLPINTIVYLSIGVLVLAAIIFLIVHFTGTGKEMDYQALHKILCIKLISHPDCWNQNLGGVTTEAGGEELTLGNVCAKLSIGSDNDCKESCGCYCGNGVCDHGESSITCDRDC